MPEAPEAPASPPPEHGAAPPPARSRGSTRSNGYVTAVLLLVLAGSIAFALWSLPVVPAVRSALADWLPPTTENPAGSTPPAASESVPPTSSTPPASVPPAAAAAPAPDPAEQPAAPPAAPATPEAVPAPPTPTPAPALPTVTPIPQAPTLTPPPPPTTELQPTLTAEAAQVASLIQVASVFDLPVYPGANAADPADPFVQGLESVWESPPTSAERIDMAVYLLPHNTPPAAINDFYLRMLSASGWTTSGVRDVPSVIDGLRQQATFWYRDNQRIGVSLIMLEGQNDSIERRDYLVLELVTRE
jgi:hypothetical protein